MAFGGGGFAGLSNGLRHSSNPGGGLPFAGIPGELLDGVKKILAREPEHPAPTAVFTHQRPEDESAKVSIPRLLLTQRKALGLSAVLIGIETVSLQAGPLLTQVGIDHGIVPRNLGVMVAVALAYLVTVFVTAVASRSRVRWTGRLAAWVMHDLRVRIFRQIQRMSLDYFTEEKAGVIMTRMTSDVEALQQLLQDGLAQFAIQGLTMIFVVAVLVSYSPVLAGITLVLILPLLTVFSLWFRRTSHRGYLRVRDGIAGVLSDLDESLHGVRVIVAHNRQHQNVLNHRKIVGAYRKANNYTAQIASVYGSGTDTMGLLAQAAILLAGGDMVLHHHLTVGELTAYVLYLNSLFLPVQQLVAIYNNYQQGTAAVVKIRDFLATDPTVRERPGMITATNVRGELEFRDVHFGYAPEQPVITDVNLTIRAGETVAFVGPTGAGKSTLAKLVTRFYDPTAGQVLLDGQDIRDLSLRSLRTQLGVVPQEPFLFAGTLKDNIAFGRPDATDADIADTIAAIGLAPLVARLDGGLDARLHERGQSLSSGERQLLALARAFLVQPRVLVLDEATSNLDREAEETVEAALDTLLVNRTAILIAHRLSTAMRADRIVVVADGGIAETGPHDELLRADGRYAQMYATWVAHSRSANRGERGQFGRNRVG